MSDPHFALIAHLKTFTYAFQKVILARAAHEVRNGNSNPLYVLGLAYVPTMIAVDAVRSLVQGIGGAPVHSPNSISDAIWTGEQRAGMLGTAQFAVDTYHHGASTLLGPAAGQAIDAVRQPLHESLINAIPNPFLKQAATTLD